MDSFERLITKKYVNSGHIIDVLKKYDVLETIKNVFDSLNKGLEKSNLKTLAQNAGLFLSKINPKLSRIQDEKDKEIIELFIADLAQPFIEQLVTEDPSGQSLLELTNSLKLSCEFEGYNSDVLFALLGVERHRTLLKATMEASYYYSWKDKPFKLDQLAKLLRKEGILINPWKEFLGLFKDSGDNKVCFERSNRDLLLVLFHMMYEMKVIQPRRISGKYATLNRLAVDKHGDVLFDVQPNKRMERIKRNPQNYDELRQKANSLLKEIGLTRGQ